MPPLPPTPWRRRPRRGRVRRGSLRLTRQRRRPPSRLTRWCSALGLTIAGLLLPLLPGCNRRTATPPAAPTAPESPCATPTSPKTPATPVPESGRKFQFRGVDHEYRGSTHLQPNQPLIHRKESHD